MRLKLNKTAKQFIREENTIYLDKLWAQSKYYVLSSNHKSKITFSKYYQLLQQQILFIYNKSSFFKNLVK